MYLLPPPPHIVAVGGPWPPGSVTNAAYGDLPHLDFADNLTGTTQVFIMS